MATTACLLAWLPRPALADAPQPSSAGDASQAASAGDAPHEPRTDAARASTDRAPPSGTSSQGSTARTVGFVLAGLGVVGLGIGGYFAISAASDAGSASSDPLLCAGGSCTEAGRSALDSIRTQRTLAAVLVGGGMVGLAGGSILLTIGEHDTSAPATPTIALTPIVGPDAVGIGLVGTL